MVFSSAAAKNEYIQYVFENFPQTEHLKLSLGAPEIVPDSAYPLFYGRKYVIGQQQFSCPLEELDNYHKLNNR